MKHFLNFLFSLALCFSSVACSQQRLSNGLVAYYPFNGNVKDESGNGWNGEVHGAVLAQDRFGIPKRAYYFDPSAGNTITTHFPGILGSKPRTISFWQTSDAQHKAISMSYGSGERNQYTPGCTFLTFVQRLNRNQVIAGVDLRYGGIAYVIDDNTTRWHHYCFVVPVIPQPKTQDVKIFRDGVLMNKVYSNWGDVAISTLDSFTFTIGQFVNSANFGGSLDDIRIYNRAFSDSEIQDLFHEGGWSGDFSTDDRDYLETYGFYREGTDSYLKLTLSELTRTPSNRVNAQQVGSLLFYLPPDNLCRRYTTSTRCDLNALPISTFPQGISASQFVYVLRTQRTQPELTLNVYDPNEPQNLNTLQYSAASASELGKVCRLIMPPNLPSDFKGFFGEGNEIHNDVRVLNCILWDLAGTVLELKASQADQSVPPSDLSNTYARIKPYQKYYYTRGQ